MRKSSITFFLVLTTCLIGAFFFRLQTTSKTLFGLLGNSIYLVADCSIYDFSGKLIKHFPHWRCALLENGGMITADPSSTDAAPFSLWDSRGNRIWSKPLVSHHTISLCRNRKAAVLITSSDKRIEGQLTRGDGITIIDLLGNILHQWNLLDHYNEIKLPLRLGRSRQAANYFIGLNSKAHSELTKVMAAYEIPENDNSKRMSAFQNGNFIVTNFGGPLVVLSANLGKILWISKKNYLAQDAQVLENGNILLFRNKLEGFGGESSFLLEIAPIDESVVWQYRGNPEPNTPFMGSVSFKNGLYVQTGISNLKKITVINRAGDVLTSFTGRPYDGNPFSHVQFLENIDFLKNNSTNGLSMTQ